jgi:hypothetical protein
LPKDEQVNETGISIDSDRVREEIEDIRETGIPVSRKLKREKAKKEQQEYDYEEEIEREDLSEYSYVTMRDLDVTDLLDEIVEYRYPNFRMIIRGNEDWTKDEFTEEFMTDKKVGFKRLSAYDQTKLNQTITRINRTKGGFRNISPGDMENLAFSLENCFILDPEKPSSRVPRKFFMKMPPIQLMWLSRKATMAQGFSKEVFENLP